MEDPDADDFDFQIEQIVQYDKPNTPDNQPNTPDNQPTPPDDQTNTTDDSTNQAYDDEVGAGTEGGGESGDGESGGGLMMVENLFGGRSLYVLGHQGDHFRRMINIWNSYLSLIDCSGMGSGKNVLLIALAMYFKMPILAIAPTAAVPVWKKLLAKYQIPTYGGSAKMKFVLTLPALTADGHNYLMRYIESLPGLTTNDIIVYIYNLYKTKNEEIKYIIPVPALDIHLKFVSQMDKIIEYHEFNNIFTLYMNMYNTYIKSNLLVKLPEYPKKLREGATEQDRINYAAKMQEYEKFDVSNIIITYGKLRSKAKGGPTHELLTVCNQQNDILGTGFYPSIRLNALLDEGCICAFDEMHNIKNANLQFEACRTLSICLLKKDNNKSRLSFISGTPFDKEEHAINLMKLIGFIRNPRLCVATKNSVNYLGAGELISICKKIDFETTRSLYDPDAVKTMKDVQSLCYKLFIAVVKPAIISRMPPPKLDAVLDISNSYYNMEYKDASLLHQQIQQLSNNAKYNVETNQCYSDDMNQVAISAQLENIELFKVPILVRLAINKLTENEFNKVIIYISFHKSINALAERLKNYNPLFVHGQIDIRTRDSAFELFQTDPRYRLIIISIGTGSESRSLCDKDGRYPRFMYIVPNHHLLRLLQAIYRIFRIGVKSNATVEFIYSKQSKIESSILNAIIKKKEKLGDVIGEDVCISSYKEKFEDDPTTTPNPSPTPPQTTQPTQTALPTQLANYSSVQTGSSTNVQPMYSSSQPTYSPQSMTPMYSSPQSMTSMYSSPQSMTPMYSSPQHTQSPQPMAPTQSPQPMAPIQLSPILNLASLSSLSIKK